MKDSRDITDDDRNLILSRCGDCEEGGVLISHGTFTMEIAARHLAKSNLRKTIVLFGAAIPAGAPGSDAPLNFIFALDEVQKLGNGVYVAMNGEVYMRIM